MRRGFLMTQVRGGIRPLVEWVGRHPLIVLLLSLGLTAGAILLIPRLTIKSDLADLLPPSKPSVQRLQEIENRLGTQSDMILAISSPSFEQNVAFGTALAERIRLTLRDRVGMVQFHRDRTYFEDHALMYVSVPDLTKLRDRVRERIQTEVRRSMAESVGGGDLADDEDDGSAPPLDEFDQRDQEAAAAARAAQPAGEDAPATLGGDSDQAELDRLAARFEEYDIDEYLRTPDGTMVIIKVRPFFPPTKLEQARELEQAIRRLIAELQPTRFHPELKVELKGDYAEKQAEIGGIQSDIFSSALVCLLALMLVIGLLFRSARAVPLVLVPTVMAILWTLGVTEVTIGHLNIVSSFIFAILVGMGIDYAIHGMARYDEERRRGHDAREALTVALRQTGLSNVTAATTTIVVFSTLLLADFRGFSEFGLIAAIGIALSILCVFVVFPSLVFLFERVRPGRQRPPRHATPEAAARSARLGAWQPPTWLAASIVVVSLAGAVFAIVRTPDIGFEYSFSKLSAKVRQATPAVAPPAVTSAAAAPTAEVPAAPAPATSATAPTTPPGVAPAGSGSAPARRGAAVGHKEEEKHRYLEAVGQDSDVAPAVVLTETLEETRLVHDTFLAIIDLPPEDIEHPERWPALLQPIRTRYPDPVEWMRYAKSRIYPDVISLWKYVPGDQEQKLALIGETRRLIERKINLFQGKEREQLDRLLRFLRTGPVKAEEFPEWVLEQFRDRQGQLGRFVLFRAKGSKTSFETTSRLKQTFWDLQFGDQTFPVAAAYFVLPEAVETIQHDGKVTISLGLVAVLVLLLVQFRRLDHALLVLVPPLFGACSVLGFLYLAGIKLNFFNVVIFPLLIGLGVDNGIHLLHRLGHREGDGFLYILRHTGGAMFLTTLTTNIGFAGLFGANHFGLQTLGMAAVAGMTGCLLASLLTLPSLILLGERFAAWRRQRAA